MRPADTWSSRNHFHDPLHSPLVRAHPMQPHYLIPDSPASPDGQPWDSTVSPPSDDNWHSRQYEGIPQETWDRYCLPYWILIRQPYLEPPKYQEWSMLDQPEVYTHLSVEDNAERVRICEEMNAQRRAYWAERVGWPTPPLSERGRTATAEQSEPTLETVKEEVKEEEAAAEDGEVGEGEGGDDRTVDGYDSDSDGSTFPYDLKGPFSTYRNRMPSSPLAMSGRSLTPGSPVEAHDSPALSPISLDEELDLDSLWIQEESAPMASDSLTAPSEPSRMSSPAPTGSPGSIEDLMLPSTIPDTHLSTETVEVNSTTPSSAKEVAAPVTTTPPDTPLQHHRPGVPLWKQASENIQAANPVIPKPAPTENLPNPVITTPATLAPDLDPVVDRERRRKMLALMSMKRSASTSVATSSRTQEKKDQPKFPRVTVRNSRMVEPDRTPIGRVKPKEKAQVATRDNDGESTSEVELPRTTFGHIKGKGVTTSIASRPVPRVGSSTLTPPILLSKQPSPELSDKEIPDLDLEHLFVEDEIVPSPQRSSRILGESPDDDPPGDSYPPSDTSEYDDANPDVPPQSPPRIGQKRCRKRTLRNQSDSNSDVPLKSKRRRSDRATRKKHGKFTRSSLPSAPTSDSRATGVSRARRWEAAPGRWIPMNEYWDAEPEDEKDFARLMTHIQGEAEEWRRDRQACIQACPGEPVGKRKWTTLYGRYRTRIAMEMD